MAKKEEAPEVASNPTGIEDVTAKTPDSGRELTVSFNYGANLQDMTSKFGEAIVYSQAQANIRINLQALLRRHMVDTFDKEGKKTADAKSDVELRELVAGWKPGMAARARKSPKDKLAALLEKISPDERAALLKEAAAELAAA